MHVTNIHDAKARLSELIKRALAGEEVVIAKAGEPMVWLTPIQHDLTPRQGGQLKGKIRIADNFDDFDEELEEMFYGPQGMKLLLDTHVFLWWLEDPSLLADPARLEIANPRNAVYVGAASVQEIVIKQAKNRLTCPEPLLPLVDANKFSPLPITLDHAQAMSSLPQLHKDPFDRQLLAQCVVEAMTLVTRDRLLVKYGVSFLLA